MDDRALFHVFDGKILVTNTLGAARASNQMEVLAKAGIPPLARSIVVPDLVQWWLRYPVPSRWTNCVLLQQRGILGDTLAAWRRGDISIALGTLPADYRPQTPAEFRTFSPPWSWQQSRRPREQWLDDETAPPAEGLFAVIAAARHTSFETNPPPATASGWLG